MRALLSAAQPLPPLAQVISATAPLPVELAREAEAAWGTRVLEIFGATEVGSIASRRTVEGDAWRAYRTVRLAPAGENPAASAATAALVAHLPGPVILADQVELLRDDSFRLLGRQTDVVKLAGKRASLAGLSAILRGIEGVEDGAFFAPDDLDSNPRARLAALVVAPTRSADEIASALRARVEAPFLPRRVVKVDSLPRNEVGKLPRSALAELLRRDGTNPVGHPGAA
jgi:acyl-coenzyme A synthetase/AMP-(fatty) acid ligase